VEAQSYHPEWITVELQNAQQHTEEITSVLSSCGGSFSNASFFCVWPSYGAFFFYRRALFCCIN
jgi:hypothetical protein